MTELEVDGVIEITGSEYIQWAFQNCIDNGYISHEIKFKDLLLVTTEKGLLAVKSKNYTFLLGLIVKLHHHKLPSNYKRKHG